MEAPIISFDGGKVTVSFTPPPNSSHAILYLFEGKRETKHMYDEATGTLLKEGKVGRAMKALLTPLYSGTTLSTRTCIVKELQPDTVYTATFATREADEVSFGAESLRSLPKSFAPPKSPAEPRVRPHDCTSATVFYVAPLSAHAIKIYFNDLTSTHVDLTTPDFHSGSVLVQGLDLRTKYKVRAIAFSSVGPSSESPSTTYCAADHAPIAPPAPDVEVLGDTSVKVGFATPTDVQVFYTTGVMLTFEAGGEKFSVIRPAGHPGPATFKLVPAKELNDFVAAKGVGFFPPMNSVETVTGLKADTTYAISVRARNQFGFSPPSPATTVTTEKSEIEVTGVRSSEERDAELMKDAVDVDESPAKRAKQSAGGAVKRPRDEPTPAADADFEPAGAYAGSRPGFVFTRGAKGLGYYREPPKKK